MVLTGRFIVTLLFARNHKSSLYGRRLKLSRFKTSSPTFKDDLKKYSSSDIQFTIHKNKNSVTRHSPIIMFLLVLIPLSVSLSWSFYFRQNLITKCPLELRTNKFIYLINIRNLCKSVVNDLFYTHNQGPGLKQEKIPFP